jgi:2-aminoethylphosphonate-pyruvate transaminase
MITTAVILAAGLGSRLKDRTQTMPKGFIPVGGKPLIERSMENLLGAGIERIIIGTGHAAEYYEEYAERIPQISCFKNEHYSSTGSMYTLYNLRERIGEDFLLLESDLLYEKAGLTILMNNPRPDVILASGPTSSGDEVFIETDAGYLVNMSKQAAELKSSDAELVGITKISYPTFIAMCAYAEQEFPDRPRLDYEYVLVGVGKSIPIQVERVSDYAWCEIDDENHLRRAKNFILPKIKEREAK